MSRRGGWGGFTVLDGVALVIGAAIASVHLRDLVVQQEQPSGLGWVLVWLTFTGVALSTAGPFLFLERRFLRRPAGYPRTGDWLWALLGIPWLVAAPLRPRVAKATGLSPEFTLYQGALWTGLLAASLIALGAVWRTWVIPPPPLPRPKGGDPAPWTDRIGLILAIAWPLQCGFGLVVVG